MNELRTQTVDKKTPFKRWNICRKNATEYEENPKFRIAGKDISIKDYQNKNAIDCNIYEVMEKYNGNLQMTTEQLNQFHTELNDELTNIKTLPDALMQIKEGENAWKQMPLEERARWGHSINNFIKNGPEYYNKKVQEINEMKTKLEAENQPVNEKEIKENA